MNISGIEIGVGHPCRLVAEIGNSHNGDIERAFRLITAAHDNGADFVKFQCYTPDELVNLRGDGPAPDPWGSEGWSMRDLYEKAQTPFEWFPQLVKHCEDVGIPWFSSVFGPKSMALLGVTLKCPAYKIASLDRNDRALREYAPGWHKPVIVSHPGPRAPKDECAYLYCPPGYPQSPDMSLRPLNEGRFIGLSYHGTDWAVPAKAVVMGAQMVEFHFHLEDEPSELEANVCLSENDLKELAECVQHANASARS